MEELKLVLEIFQVLPQLVVFQALAGVSGGIAIIDGFMSALRIIGTPMNITILILGTIIGVVAGIIPGMGGTTAMALLIPITFDMDPIVAVMFIAAINGGTSQGGSITSILLNVPGRAPNAATLLDGYPMTRQGRGGEAIGVSATASALGAILGVAVLILTLPFLALLALLFSPYDVFWLAIWGLTTVAVVVRGRVITGLISAGLGLLFAMQGYNLVTGDVRWVFGIAQLLDGFRLIPALIGLFAIGEMVNLLAKGETIALDRAKVGGDVWKGVKTVFVHKFVFLRAALIGLFIGIIPGVGGTAANYIGYFQTVQSSSDPEKFGTGDVRGVIGAEAANDAKEGGAYIPTLGFGIPGSPSMVLLLAVILFHGIIPGPFLVIDHLDLVMAIILGSLVSNIISSVVVILLGDRLVAVTNLKPSILAATIVPLTFVASYALHGNYFDIVVTFLFGVIGFLMLRVNMSRVPLLLGMVLGPVAEENFLRSLSLGNGDLGIFFKSPISQILIVLTISGLLFQFAKPQLRKVASRIS